MRVIPLLIRLGQRLRAQLRSKVSPQFRRLPEPDRDRPVLFVGDSLAQLWAVEDPSFFHDHGYVNRGRGGATTAALLRTFQDDIVGVRPRCVHIICGINDVVENEGYVRPRKIVGNLRTVVKACRSRHIEVVVASILPVSSVPWRPRFDPRHRIECTNILIKKMCEEQNVAFLDYHSRMTTTDLRLPDELTTDGLHLNALGYKRLSATLRGETPGLGVAGEAWLE